MRTTKIFDTTVISASVNEIHCIDLLEICSTEYNLCTSKEVEIECKKGFSHRKLEHAFDRIETIDLRENLRYWKALTYLKARYPYLHNGELSSFLVALLRFAALNREYFYITDDSRMRRRISEILESEIIVELVGKGISDFHITGTIGLIKRLCEKGCIKREEIDRIISEIKDSTFYISDYILKELKRCIIHEDPCQNKRG